LGENPLTDVLSRETRPGGRSFTLKKRKGR